MEDQDYLERLSEINESTDMLEFGSPTEEDQARGLDSREYEAMIRTFNEERARTGRDIDWGEFKYSYVNERFPEQDDPVQQMFNKAVGRVFDDLAGRYRYEEPTVYYEGRSKDLNPFE